MRLLDADCQEWGAPPADLGLFSDEVHVWRISLDAGPGLVARLLPLLSPEEGAQAGRMGSDTIRRRFVVSHAAQRLILSRYSAVDPALLSIVAAGEGKPCLVPGSAHPGLSFNLSHSHDLALLAVARDREVGVDLERIRPVRAWAEVAERYFTPGEFAEWRGLPEEQRLEGFFLCWTRKEAYSKALGLGLSRCWTRFHVSLTPGAPVVLRDDDWDGGTRERFELRAVFPGTDFVGAVAAQGTGWRLRCFQWSMEGYEGNG